MSVTTATEPLQQHSVAVFMKNHAKSPKSPKSPKSLQLAIVVVAQVTILQIVMQGHMQKATPSNHTSTPTVRAPVSA